MFEFDFSEEKKPLEQKDKGKDDKILNDQKKFIKFKSKMTQRVNTVKEIIERLPNEDEQCLIITQKSFNIFALLLFLAKEFDLKEVYIAIYRIDINSVEGLKELVELGSIENLNIVLSSFFRGSKKQELWHNNLVKFAKENDKTKLIYCWNHAKVIAVQTKCNKYFVIEGSGNLSNNARIEQYRFEQSKQSFDFHKKWMNDVVNMSAKKDVTII